MKKLISILLILTLAFAFVSCGDNDVDDNNQNNTTNNENNNGNNENNDEKLPENVMTYAEYMAAAVDAQIVVAPYVQAHQTWYNGKITVYAADKDGAYFCYDMACSEADAAKLTPGTRILVTGYKTVWHGEVEIVDATFEFVKNADTYIAPAKDATNILASDNLVDYQNQLVSFKELKISGVTYKNGTPGDDIYVSFTKGGKTYEFCVERYLTGPETEVYKAFETLAVGDVVDVEGFLYWYETANTHITSIKKSKSEGTKTYTEYMAADVDTEVTIEAYVQAHQSWYNNKITVYAADTDGAYFCYDMACSEADAAKLTPGTKIKVTGYKTIWHGEVEITDATFEFVENAGTFIAEAKDLTLTPAAALIDYQNQLVLFKNLIISSISYKNGTPGDDIYVDFTGYNGNYSFCVERYLTDPETDVYKAFATLQVGDIVDVEGFLYWYETANTHITSVTKMKSAGAVTYDTYMYGTAVDTEVTIEAYVQAHQSWYNNKITVYAADRDGGYFIYDMACSEADAAKLTPGTKIRVTGYKAIWHNEVELVDATFEFIENEGTFVAPAKDLTAFLEMVEIIQFQNQLGLFKGLTIKSIEYKNGTPGDDIYVTFTKDGTDYSFCVERYLTDPETEVYKAFETLAVGDVVDVEGFLYWYETINTHITKITKVA